LLPDFVCPLCENDPNFLIDETEQAEEHKSESDASDQSGTTHTSPSSNASDDFEPQHTVNSTLTNDQTVLHNDDPFPSQMFPGLVKGFLLPPPRIPPNNTKKTRS